MRRPYYNLTQSSNRIDLFGTVMLERTSLPPAVPADIRESLQQTLGRRWPDVLQELLWLPATPRQYLLFVAIALVVGAGMMVQIWYSVQIAEARAELRGAAARQQQIERENGELIYAIATSTTLERIRRAAVQQGYTPATDRVYVRRDEVATDAIPGLGADAIPPVAAALRATSGTAAPATGPFDAAMRGLGAAGAWLGDAATQVQDAIARFADGIRERWAP